MEETSEQSPKQFPNLKPPFKAGEKRTIEMARKAGKTKTKRKTAAVRMNARKYCDSKCPIYRDCPYMFESMKTEGRP